MLLRIDNIFFNTPDVKNLATFYSRLLSLPIRRQQYEGSGVNWMEINVGGMELSFRRFEGTEEVHPELKNEFLEITPGNGGTISFEVKDIEKEINELKSKGVNFVTDIIKCTDGLELISIFKDPFGKPVQLYESKFDSVESVEAAGGRQGSAFANNAETFITSNVRNVQGLALSVAMQVPDLKKAHDFYVSVLGLNPILIREDILILEIDGSRIEIRGTEKSAHLHGNGVSIAVEVLDLQRALKNISTTNIKPAAFSPSYELIEDIQLLIQSESNAAEVNRGALRDIEGNMIEIWQKSI